jgi:hypothetical protein
MNNIVDPLIKNTPFSEEEMTNYFYTKVKEDKDEMEKSLWKKWDRNEADWNDLMPKKDGNCVSSSITSTSTNATIPRLVDEVFGYSYPITVVGDNTPQGKLLESEGRKLFSYHIESSEDLQNNLWHFISNSAGFGVSFAYTYMEIEKEEYEVNTIENVLLVDGQPALSPEGVPIQPNPEVIQGLGSLGKQFQVIQRPKPVKQWKYKKYKPRTITLDNKHVIFGSSAISLQDAFESDYVAIRIFKTLDQIIKLIHQPDKEALYSKINDIKAKEFALKNKNETDLESLLNRKSKKIEFWLIFGRYDINNDGQEEQVDLLIHPASKTLLGYEIFPYKHARCPIVAGCIMDKHNKVCGKGIPDLLFHYKTRLDKSINRRLNLMDIDYPIIQYSKNSGFDKSKMKLGFQESWEVDSNEIKIENFQYQYQNYFKEEQEVKEDAQKITSLADVAMGVESQNEQTFRGIMTMLDEGSKSRGMYTKWISKPVQEIFEQIYMLYQQYFIDNAQIPQVQEYIYNILDNGKKNITPQTIEALKHKWNVRVKATSSEKKSALIKAKEKHDFLVNDPNVQASPDHIRKAKISVLSAIDDEDPESSYPTTEQLEALQQQRITIAQKQIAEEQKKSDMIKLQEEEYNKEKGRQEAVNIVEQTLTSK